MGNMRNSRAGGHRKFKDRFIMLWITREKKRNKFLAKLKILCRPALAAYISWNMHVSTYESIDIVKKENTEICPFSINLIRVPLAIICFPPPNIDSISLLIIDRLYFGNSRQYCLVSILRVLFFFLYNYQEFLEIITCYFFFSWRMRYTMLL